MLMVGVMTVVLVLSLVGVCIAGYLVAAHRVRSAADLAALSGAGAMATGLDPCAAAQRNARVNGVRVAACDVVGDRIDFVVTVRVELRVRVAVRGLPSVVRAEASAGSQPS
jgi:secretion/DNA translocation related TadE-like protein